MKCSSGGESSLPPPGSVALQQGQSLGSHGPHQGGGRLAAGGPSLPPGSGVASTSLASVSVPGGAYAAYSNYGVSSVSGMSGNPVSSPQRGHQRPPGNNGHPPNSANNALGMVSNALPGRTTGQSTMPGSGPLGNHVTSHQRPGGPGGPGIPGGPLGPGGPTSMINHVSIGVTGMSDLLSSAQQAVGSSSSTAKLLPTAISCAPGQSSSNSLSVLGAAGIGSGGSLPGYSGAHTQVKVSSVHGEGGTHHQIASVAAGGSLSSKSVGGVSNSGMSGAMSGVIYSTVNSDMAGGGGHNRAMSTPELAVCGPTYQRPPGIQSLAVPPGGGIPPVRPPHSMPARRGNNVTASKRTRFALQRPTGEESGDSLDNPQVSQGQGGQHQPGAPNNRATSPRARGRGRGGSGPRRSRSPGPKGRIQGNSGSKTIDEAGMSGGRLYLNGEEGVYDPVDHIHGGHGGHHQHSSKSRKSGGAPRPPTSLPSGLPHQPEAACSPITLEYAEELLLLAKKGKCSTMDISDEVKERPPGGYVYIFHNKERPYAWKDEDGYHWTQILHQMALHTAKGNELDYYHFYIELASRHSDKIRSSPNFRKEAYRLGDYTLVAYIGKSDIVRRRERSLAEKHNENNIRANIHKQLQDMGSSNGIERDQMVQRLLDDKNRLTEDLRRLTEKQVEEGVCDIYLASKENRTLNEQIVSLLPDDLKGLASQFSDVDHLAVSSGVNTSTHNNNNTAQSNISRLENAQTDSKSKLSKHLALSLPDRLTEELQRLGAAPTTSSAAITASSGSQIQAEELRRLASQLPADELKRLTGRLHDDLKKLNLNQQQSAAVGSSANNSLQFSSGQHPLLHSQLGRGGVSGNAMRLTGGAGGSHPHLARQRSQSLERTSNQLRNGLGMVGMCGVNRYLSDPDMVAAQLVEQEYLQALVNAKSAPSKNKFQLLMDLSVNLSNGKLVKNISIFPSLQVTLVHPDMTREFENICRILYSERCPGDLAEDTIKLFYDHTFQIGSLYLTILTYTNYFYLGSPVMPLAVNIHERRFKSSHSMFWARVLCDIPALAKYRFPLVINESEPSVHLAVKAHAPNLVQFEGWVHRFDDMEKYMRDKGYGAHAVAYFKACVKYLLMSDSRNEMQDKFRKEFEGIWPRDFINYFRERILPKANRLGKWALGEHHVYDETFFNHAGSPQERFHMRCNQFHRWDTLSLPQLFQGCYLLFCFYVNECSRGKAGQGIFAIHPDLKPLFCEVLPENLPYNRCPNPSNIVDYLHAREAAQRNSSNPSLHASLPLPTSTFSSLPPHMEGVLGPSSLPAPSHMEGSLASQYLGGGASGGSGGKGGRTNLSFQEDFITNQQVYGGLEGEYGRMDEESWHQYSSYLNPSVSQAASMMSATSLGGPPAFPPPTSMLPSTFTLEPNLEDFSISKLPGYIGNVDGSEEVPSPAPGGSPRLPSSPHRKLSIIPEIPGLSDSRYSSRPPSLAEINNIKTKDLDPSVMNVPGLDMPSSNSQQNRNSRYGGHGPRDLAMEGGMRGHGGHMTGHFPSSVSAQYDRLHQHSIDSSIVTEGHYDASFETEDHPNDHRGGGGGPDGGMYDGGGGRGPAQGKMDPDDGMHQNSDMDRRGGGDPRGGGDRGGMDPRGGPGGDMGGMDPRGGPGGNRLSDKMYRDNPDECGRSGSPSAPPGPPYSSGAGGPQGPPYSTNSGGPPYSGSGGGGYPPSTSTANAMNQPSSVASTVPNTNSAQTTAPVSRSHGPVSKVQSVPTHFSGMDQLNQVKVTSNGEEGMMLWKRVRHCVVFGASSSNKSKKEKR